MIINLNNRTREPQIHSHITDALPAFHSLAYKTVYCDNHKCQAMLHNCINECMQTWVEMEGANFCLRCFYQIKGDVLENP